LRLNPDQEREIIAEMEDSFDKEESSIGADGGRESAEAIEEGVEDAGESTLSDQDREIIRLTQERDDYLRALQLLQADFENFKKRAAKQQSESKERANEVLVVSLLPALDTLSLAMSHAKDGESDPSTVEQVCRAIFEALLKEGLEEIAPLGERFDPEVAEAVAHEQGDGEARVVEVFRSGYRWKGRVLRPAMVRVAG
jgi:molecular chaperone GrpE